MSTWIDIKAFFREQTGVDHPDPGHTAFWLDLGTVTWIGARRHREEDGTLTFGVDVCSHGQLIPHPCETIESAEKVAEKLKELVVSAQAGKWMMQAQLQERMADRMDDIIRNA